ncbi:hypothetical protein N9L26_00195 [Candidatus Pacebacteria bacterium]|nr:hypothetical protein [Candidatus Paceibacterota bacterium]
MFKHSLVSLVFFLILVPLVSEARGYKVTPRVISHEVKQRDILSETITITNDNNYTLNVYATVNEVSIDDGGDITSFVPPSMSDGTLTPTSWIELKRGRISIPAGKTQEVPLGIKVHPQAEAGEYHILLGFGSGHNRPSAEQQVKNGTAPSIVVTLSVDQNQTEFLKLGRFIVDRFVTQSDNSAISYTLNNPGTADVQPAGEIIFSDSRGEEVAAVPINPNGDRLAPGQETTYTAKAPTEGLMGKYKAFLSVDYGTEQVASVYDTTFFYVLPLSRLLIIFAVIMLLAIAATVLLHRRYAGPLEEEVIDHEELPMYIRDSQSEEKEHDINLKQ